MPPREEQTQIAKFLDYETAKIDKQRQLIALLNEKRQAVISHAVTKGLNPDAPLRDSGINWLGKIPAHWELKRVKHLASTISKGTTPSTVGKDMAESGVRFIKAENVGKSLSVSPSPEFFISRDTDRILCRSRLKSGDVLVIIAGATTGLCSVVSDDILPANTNQAVSFVRPRWCEHSQFIARWISTEFAQRTIWMGAVQAAQPNLSMHDLGNIPIPLPPPGELDEILEATSGKVQRIGALLEQAETAVDLLQERRAAVTAQPSASGWASLRTATSRGHEEAAIHGGGLGSSAQGVGA